MSLEKYATSGEARVARKLVREAADLCDPAYDCGRWFEEDEGRINYHTGEHERRSLHPPRNITPSSYARLKRALGVR